MNLDRIPLHTTATPRTTAVLVRRGPFLHVEPGPTMDPRVLAQVVGFLTSPSPRRVLGKIGEGQVDGVSWTTRTPADDPDDLACALSELARFGVVPDWSELVDDGDLVDAP